MEYYPKLFIKTSLIYLFIGVALGFHISMESAFNISRYAWVLRFAHIHLNLVGFMGMMIFGVAYHILPRFNARPVPYPKLIPAHFHLTNIGLFGMVTFFTLNRIYGGIFQWLFALFATTLALAIFLFVINMYSVLREGKQESEEKQIPLPEEKKPEEKPINPEPPTTPYKRKPYVPTPTKPSDFQRIIDKPDTDLSKVIGKKKGSIQRGDLCTKDILIGELLKTYPEVKDVFEKYYGAACFSCPGQAYETVEQAAAMHGKKADVILEEINKVIEGISAK